MRGITGILLMLLLAAFPVLLWAQEEGEKEFGPPLAGDSSCREPGSGEEESHPHIPEGWRSHRHGQGRGKFPGPRFKEFREELRALGREIRENKALVQGLEKEMEAMPAGLDRAEVRKKLDEARRRQAGLELKLAQRRVEITQRALERSRKRYDDARLELEEVKKKIGETYPDLIPPDQPN